MTTREGGHGQAGRERSDGDSRRREAGARSGDPNLNPQEMVARPTVSSTEVLRGRAV